ncbi:MAG: hypothetical protein CMM30_04095 [Rhodospirillaceae bacterium]|nr:hypothetical protein [Rhodospirillaceae bacterium]
MSKSKNKRRLVENKEIFVENHALNDDAEKIGNELRDARIRIGLELCDVADTLRIQLAYLEALEEGRISDLPGTVYILGFVRTYSVFLELDADTIVQRYKQIFPQKTNPDKLDFPDPIRESRTPKPWLILIVLILAGLAYAGWYYVSSYEQGANKLASDLSDSTNKSFTHDDLDMLNNNTAKSASSNLALVDDLTDKEAIWEDAGNLSKDLDLSQENQLNSNISSDNIIQEVDIDSSTTPVNEINIEENLLQQANSSNNSLWIDNIETDSNIELLDIDSLAEDNNIQLQSGVGDKLSSDSVKNQVFGEINENFRILILAKADSWVQVQGPENELLITRILRTGDRYRVPDRIGLTMITGNAGALEISVDGVVVDPVGPVGAVRRNIALDPKLLLAGGAVVYED